MADPQNAAGLAVVFAGVSALAWGAGDFSGGLASKRASALSVMPISTSAGLLLLAVVATVRRAPMVTSHDALFAFLAGIFGAVGCLTALERYFPGFGNCSNTPSAVPTPCWVFSQAISGAGLN